MEERLLQKLVAIPSFVDKKTNEIAVANFIFNILNKNTKLKIKKEFVGGGRFNILAYHNKNFKKLIAGHMDTVEIGKGMIGGKKGKKIDNKFFGRGSMDTKGGIASLLSAILELKNINDCGFLFYCGEESDFIGMKSFIKKHPTLPAKICLVIEPTNLKLWNSHRGLIEIHYKIKGLTGHSSNPKIGISTNSFFVKVVGLLEKELSKFKTSELGESTLNIPFVKGGFLLSKKENDIILSSQGNNIPDYCEFIIEIRTAKSNLNAETVSSIVKKFFSENKITVTEEIVKHNLGALITPKASTKIFEKLIKEKEKYLDGSKKGYGDGEMIAKAFKIPVFYLGPKGEGAHSDKEYVETDSLRELKQIYKEIISQKL